MSEPESTSIARVLAYCIQIDQIAMDEYERMSEVTENPEVCKLFVDLRADERRHIHWWETLEQEWDEGHIPEVWGDVSELAHQLESAVEELRGSLPESYEGMDERQMLLVAARLEYMALEPAIGALIDLLGSTDGATSSRYDEHLRRLMLAIEGHRTFADPLEGFLVRALRRAWHGSTTLAQAALHDPLTALFNRRALEPLLSHSVATACRYGQPLSVMMIDVDDFKRLNDEYGHAAGDLALRRISQAIDSEVRASDFVARYGGDEFTIVASSTDVEAAEHLMDRIARTVEAIDMSLNGHVVPVTVSLGAAVLLAEPESKVICEERVMQAADQSLYEAKKAGRNRWAEPVVIAWAEAEHAR